MVDHGELVHEGDDDVRGPVADVSRLHAGASGMGEQKTRWSSWGARGGSVWGWKKTVEQQCRRLQVGG